MMKIPYVNNDASDMVKIVIDAERNMEVFIEQGLVDNPTENYVENSYDMCNMSTLIIGQQLRPYQKAYQLNKKG